MFRYIKFFAQNKKKMDRKAKSYVGNIIRFVYCLLIDKVIY